MAVVDLNNNVLYNPIRPAFLVRDPSPYFQDNQNFPLFHKTTQMTIELSKAFFSGKY